MASKATAKPKSTARAKSSKPPDAAEMTALKKQIETLKAENALLKNNFDISKLPKDMVKEQDLAGMMQEAYIKTLDELNKLKKEKGVVSGSDAKSLEEKLQKTSKELSDSEKKRKAAEEDLHVNKRRLIELEKEIGQNQNSNSNGTDNKLIDELKEKVTKLSNDNDKLMKDLVAVREHNNDLKRKYEQLQQSSNSSNQNNAAQTKLVSKLEKQLADKDRDLEEQKTRFEQVHYELSVQRNTMDSEKTKQEEEIHKLHKKVHDLEQKVKILTESKDGVDDQRQALLQQSEELKNEHEAEVSKLRESQKKQLDEVNKEYEAKASKLRNELEDNKSTIENLKVTAAQLNLRIQELEEQATKTGNTANVDEDSSRFRAMIQELKTELEVVKEEREAAKMEVKQHKMDLHAAFVNIDKKEKEIKNMEKAHKELVERKEKTINSLRRESSNVDPTVNQQIRSLKEENEALQTRISQLAGAKLQDANPGITDLSDENRPTKLGEKFSELYDNEWTEAYEEQEETMGNEQKTIEYLYKLLLDIYSFCQTVARKHAEDLQKACTLLSAKTSNNSKIPEIHLIQKKLLKDVLKSFAGCQVNDVIQNYLETNKLVSKTQPLTMGFIHKAAEVCWFMAVQDPPVILETQAKPNDNFDADIFKVYTKKGKQIDYVVWPPIRLHKDGHLIGKGVAQGK